ncbi:antibiotic biosynthesis monooxygenase [Nadsonia fulvescens var. elongata DSM 6958]|uniref:Antibiotic biosynthesis monooxygenase n=1 Tax=Nadsonia fulvescens var. elongata DSM 6958 TaxID=857566 RepID=A0A1E3PD59_9ASCO|nr:antibiotic biosynthesis monooxygenase [Nadsonia fulvescens var. elongata DSM 6958]
MSPSSFAITPKPPYYVVIFISQRTTTPENSLNDKEYNKTGDRMIELASQQPGFISVESTRNADGFGVTMSYWDSRTSILHWKRNVEHVIAQEKGKSDWYDHYEVRIAKVEKAYSMSDL